MSDNLIIQLNGLPDGNSGFHWDLGQEFFALFGNADILEASVAVCANLSKSGAYICVELSLDGSVTVPCDRCLSPLGVDIRDKVLIDVRTGGQPEAASEDREVILLPQEETSLDLSQFVYDYVCLNIPLQRVHKEGDCDPDVVRFIGKDRDEARPQVTDSPFASLGDLLKNRIK